MKFYLEEKSKVLSSVGSAENGISSAEAEKRLTENGKNKLDEGKKTSVFVRFLQQLADPMILVLIAAAAVSGIISFVEKELPTGETENGIYRLTVQVTVKKNIAEEKEILFDTPLKP